MTSDERERTRQDHCEEIPDFETLYSEYGARIYRFCHRLCGNPTEAEDLTQEVFVAAYQGLHGFQGRSSLTTWLYRIALYRRHKMRAAHRPETIDLESAVSSEAVVPDPAQAGLERVLLEDALAALSDAQREAFLLIKAEGLLYREAAEVLGVPQGTLKCRVHQAVLRLQSLLDPGESESCAIRSPGSPSCKEVFDEV